MLEIRNITVRYAGMKHNALNSINLTIHPGDFVCVLGKSGAGKSTLIRCLNGLQTPSSGEIIWDGLSFSALSDEQLRKIRREMGMIFQHFNLIPRLTVLQNVLTGMFGYRNSFKNLIGWFTDEEKAQAAQVIAEVGLADFANRRVEHLSGGQKQRVGIARALLQKPSFLLGDEPVASLDPGTSDRIFSLLQEMHERHRLQTIINVHDVQLAKRYATRIIALKDGEVVFDDKPEQFTDDMYAFTYDAESYGEKSYIRST
ncbi:phosphonate transport system ATP-binding protein [Cytobacillus firmus]|uniref:Phosphonate transport system ATP-binding protein n=2 Tax=Cytobacillus TaxID=2675230 RepID=A0A366K3K6_CYTFI|nr:MULTISPECIES: phosphonate ABC transporter ATP-binding protein [Cytobacillus]RBP96305.1 phosphonate transport system ATP-binding protein [Cytobacillus firmus]TDX45969.1 phosphonate transport system ATP-binding protein [Cytobacillus oceanisediminis]